VVHAAAHGLLGEGRADADVHEIPQAGLVRRRGTGTALNLELDGRHRLSERQVRGDLRSSRRHCRED
jgi:hypothetical protein